MRLFYKTLYLFITIIILLSVSTTVLITRAIHANQSIDASRELEREASAVYDSFNQWKRLLWRNIITLAEEDLSVRTDAFDESLLNRIQYTASRSGIDYVVLRRSTDGETMRLPLETIEQPYLDIDVFRNRKVHPYIEIVKLHQSLYFTGIVRLGSQEKGNAVDVFLIKMIDRPLLEHLTSNQRIKVVVASASKAIEGSIEVEAVPPEILNGGTEHAYTPIDEVEIDGQNYRGIMQHSGSVAVDESTEMLTLVVFLSLSDYELQLRRVNRAILYIAIIAGLVTILLSSVFSKHLTFPIHRVVQAMQRIKEGEYHTSLSSHPRGEIGELLEGFNEMTTQLAYDKQAKEHHLQQIMDLKAYNENIIDAMPEGLVVVSEDLTVEKVNRAYLQICGLEEREVTGATLDTLVGKIIDPPLVAEIRNVLSSGSSPGEVLKREVDDSSYEINLYPLSGQGGIHCIVVMEDVSERLAYEQKMFQAERLASISLMTAGMAHEINNPLSSILSNTQNLMRSEPDRQREGTLRLIEEETKRIARIVRGLLEFSTSGGEQAIGVQVNETIGDIARLIGYGAMQGHKIDVVTNFDTTCPLVAISSDELKQVLLNLVKNAMESMGDSGTLTLGTRYLGQERIVEVTVSDSGVGIEPGRIKMVFDPFYTTKRGGVGTGLGLSIVYGIIKKYKGDLLVDSTVGEGTRIICRLPVV